MAEAILRLSEALDRAKAGEPISATPQRSAVMTLARQRAFRAVKRAGPQALAHPATGDCHRRRRLSRRASSRTSRGSEGGR
jgi:hypothetical protein